MSSALIIIDVQKVWADNNPLTTARIELAAQSLREKMTVLWIYMDSTGSLLPPTRAGQGVTRRLFSQFDNSYKPSFNPHTSDYIATKKHPNGFANTDVDEFLDLKKITNLYFAGYLATQCVWATAIGAAKQNRNAHIVSDLVADYKDDLVFPMNNETLVTGPFNRNRINTLTSKDIGLNLT